MAELMSVDCMPSEQVDYIEAIMKDMLESTNMTEQEAYDFAFRCWQCGYQRVGRQTKAEIRAKAIDEFAEKIRDWQKEVYKNDRYVGELDFLFKHIYEIAEQLKERE